MARRRGQTAENRREKKPQEIETPRLATLDRCKR
jgi:hypothetical protein